MRGLVLQEAGITTGGGGRVGCGGGTGGAALMSAFYGMCYEAVWETAAICEVLGREQICAESATVCAAPVCGLADTRP